LRVWFVGQGTGACRPFAHRLQVPYGRFAVTNRLMDRSGRSGRHGDGIKAGSTERFEPLANRADQSDTFQIGVRVIDHGPALDVRRGA